MVRPYWTGQVQISLVSFGVKLYVATESKSEIRFHQISRSTGERVRHQKVLESAAQDSPGEAASAVAKEEIVKGYEYRKGEYVLVEPKELEQLRVPSRHTVSITQFVDIADLTPDYMEKPYFVTPEDDVQAEAFAVVRAALKKTGKAALGKIAFSGREHVFAITAFDDDSLGGMMGYTMRYEEELRKPEEYFRDIKKVPVQADSLELAMELIQRKAAKFNPAEFTDGYEAAVRQLVEAKVSQAPVPKDETPAPRRGQVINLMDALRKSVGTGETAVDTTSKSRKKPAGSVKTDTAAAKRSMALVKPAKSGKRQTA